MLDGAFWENILEKIFGTPFTDCRRSLLRKYFREDIWNAVHILSAEPSCKIFYKRYSERRSQIVGGAFLQNILENIFGTPFTYCRRSLLVKYSIRDIRNAVHRSSAKPLEKIFYKRYSERRSQIVGEAFLQNILENIFGTPFTDCRRSLLAKYLREYIRNAVHRLSAKPSEKIF